MYEIRQFYIIPKFENGLCFSETSKSESVLRYAGKNCVLVKKFKCDAGRQSDADSAMNKQKVLNHSQILTFKLATSFRLSLYLQFIIFGQNNADIIVKNYINLSSIGKPVVFK